MRGKYWVGQKSLTHLNFNNSYFVIFFQTLKINYGKIQYCPTYTNCKIILSKSRLNNSNPKELIEDISVLEMHPVRMQLRAWLKDLEIKEL